MNQECSQCAYYIENKKDIEATNERVSLMLNSIQDKIDNMSENNERNFEQLSDEIKSVDNRLTAIHAGIENKITNMQRNLPSQIDERIKSNSLTNIFNVVKWIVVSLCGSVVIAMATSYFTRFI